VSRGLGEPIAVRRVGLLGLGRLLSQLEPSLQVGEPTQVAIASLLGPRHPLLQPVGLTVR
jgi:hypothetical protein